MIKRLAETTFDYLKVSFTVMIVMAALCAIVSVSYARPAVATGIVIGAIVTKVLSSILSWALSKTGELENATLNVMILLLAVEIAIVFLPTAMLTEIRTKILHKG